jgi:hypothetical protein
MIKINLYASLQVMSSGNKDFESEDGGGGGYQVNQADAGVKMAITFALPLLLFFYETHNLGGKKDELAKIKGRLTEIANLTQQNGMAISEVEKYIQEKEKLKSKFELIGKLAKPRLLYIKALDALQAMIPIEVWIDQINIDPDTTGGQDPSRETDEKIIIKGKSLSYDAILKLTGSMQESIFFNKVTFRLDEQKSDRGNIRAFEITCLLKGDK